MGISRSTKIWVSAAFVLQAIVLFLFILGALWNEHSREIARFAHLLRLPVWFHVFYRGLYLCVPVVLITLGTLIGQIKKIRTEHIAISPMWMAAEVLIILVGVFDLLPMSVHLTSSLYYMIPGW